MNRNYYKQGQSSKVPYILVVVILVLLYIMNGMNEDRKDADHMFKLAIEEFKSSDCDSLNKNKQKEVDSLLGVIEWYRTESKPKYKGKIEEKKKKTQAEPTPAQSTATNDTL